MKYIKNKYVLGLMVNPPMVNPYAPGGPMGFPGAQMLAPMMHPRFR